MPINKDSQLRQVGQEVKTKKWRTLLRRLLNRTHTIWISERVLETGMTKADNQTQGS